MSEMALELIARAKRERWKRLDLGRTGIVGAVPDEVGELEDLEELILSEQWTIWDKERKLERNSRNMGVPNCISFLPRSLPFNLAVLNAHNTKIEDISTLASLHQLRRLEIAGTLVTDLSPLSELTRLISIEISDSNVSNLSPLANMTELLILEFKRTNVDNIAPLKAATQLRILRLSDTSVSDISPIGEHLNLFWLDLARTKVSNIGPLEKLLELKKLYLNRTPITDLKPISQHKKLRFIHLEGTNVTDLKPLKSVLPRGIPVRFEFALGEGIYLEDCPLIFPPKEIALKGNVAILNYFREQDRVGTLPLKELKIFLLGNTTAGKSTLAHALIYQQYLENNHSTAGANLSQSWQTKDTKVNIWDFGGQEYFHATHRLLMNDDAIYIVMSDPNFNQDGFHKTPIRYIDEVEPIKEDLEHFPHGYWLQTIQHHAPRSSGMMVWNKLDQDNCPKYGLSDADRALFDQRIQEYPLSLKGALETKDPAWQDRWRVFNHDLQRQIRQALEGKQVIQYWPSVREAVEARSKTDMRISYKEFEALCKADDPLRELGNTVIYLRDMCGAILYFGSRFTEFSEFPESRRAKDDVLQDVVFINPNKINELIYAVLNRKVKKNGGRFDHKHAVAQVQAASKQLGGTVLEMEEAETLTTELIAVMKQFDIIFETADGSGEYVAPQYLSPDVPKEVTFALKNVAVKPGFALQFKSFVPRHIVPRFIAQNGGFALDEGYWKTGILFARQETTLLLRVDYEVGRIFVDAAMTAGRDRVLRELFGELRGLIDRDQSMQVVLEDGACVDYELLLEAEQSRAALVKNVHGQYLDISRFSLFLQKEVAARPFIQNPSLLTLDLQEPVTPEKNKTLSPTIGIITALPKEYAAMEAMLDSPVTIPGNSARTKDISYTIGTMPGLGGQHCVALCWLPDMGNNLAAIAATTLLAEYPLIDKIIMVGIAGGIPHPNKPESHVRLGDIVVSDRGGVVQYDLIKESEGFREHRNPPRPPSQPLLHAVARMESLAYKRQRPYLSHLKTIIDAIGADRPDASTDTLVSSEDSKLVVDHPIDKGREVGVPRVFKGPIASANILLKDPKLRDRLRETFAVKAVEMEGSGIADAAWSHSVGYLVVRGICDYCDSRKGDDWQLYAAAVAAAYTRALLELVPGSEAVAAPEVAPATGNVGHSGFVMDRPGKKVLISYASDDELYRAELAKHLSVMERNGEIQIWYQSKTRAGEDVAQVQAAMEAADVILILLSVDYLSSAAIWEQEQKVALARRAAGLCQVTGIVLYPCDWASTPLGKITMMQRGAAVGDVKNHAAWAGVVGELKGMIGGGV